MANSAPDRLPRHARHLIVERDSPIEEN
jgi:hypothetical protein